MAVVTNFAPNPSQELDAGWDAWGGGVSNDRSNEQARTGTYSRKYVTNGTGQGPTLTVAGRVTGLTPSGVYTASVYIYGAGVWEMLWEEYDNGGSVTTYSGASVTATPASSWATRLVQTVTISGTSTGFRPAIRTHASSPASVTAYFDDLLVNEGASAEDYFDGDTTDGGGYLYDWTGTPHASTSTRTDAPTGGYTRIRNNFELRPY
jgi:hypothetical protein